MEKKTITISPTGLTILQACTYQHYLTYVERYAPLGDKSSRLEKGSFIHYLLELYYKGIREAPDVNRQALGEAIIEVSNEEALKYDFPGEVLNYLQDTFRLYIVKYLGENLIPIFVEEPFSYPLYETEEVRILLEGKVDLIGDEGVRFIYDHKTSSSKKDILRLNNQFMAYCASLGLNTVVVNRIVLTKAPQFDRTAISYTTKRLEEWKENAVLAILQWLEYDREKMYPQNLSSCYLCHFKDVCMTEVENHKGMLETLYTRREPHDLFKENS